MNTTNSATSKTPLDTFAFRPFKEDDWNGLADAERFADGCLPMISKGEQDEIGRMAFLIADAKGLTTYINGDGDKMEDTYEMRLDLEGMHKDFILAIAYAIRKDATPAQLAARGFKSFV